MSQENVETVRGSLIAFAEGGLDAMAGFWDPAIDWRAIEGAPDDVGEMHGTAAKRRYIQEWIDMFDDLTLVADQLFDVGDDRVIAEQHVTGRAKLSGAQTELRYAVVYTVRNGKILRGREYANLDQALGAAGPPGVAAPPDVAERFTK